MLLSLENPTQSKPVESESLPRISVRLKSKHMWVVILEILSRILEADHEDLWELTWVHRWVLVEEVNHPADHIGISWFCS